MAEEALPRPPTSGSQQELPRPRLSPIRDLGLVSATAIGVLAAVDLLVALTSGRDFDSWRPSGTGIVSLGLSCLAAAVFLMWSWRAYANAVALGRYRDRPAPRLSAPWVVLAWFVPVINFWFPYWVLVDQYRSSASRPTRDVRLVTAWWVSYLVWIATTALYALARIVAGPDSTPPRWLLSSFLIVLVLAEVAAAVLVILVILQITKWQESARQA